MSLRQRQHRLRLDTRGRGFHDITPALREWVRASGISQGLVTVFVRHTSASLVVQENADPDVRADLERFFARLVPDGDTLFEHVLEGADDMPAHVRAALTATSVGIPVCEAAPALGSWQAVYLYEHRQHGQRRELFFQLIGE